MAALRRASSAVFTSHYLLEYTDSWYWLPPSSIPCAYSVHCTESTMCQAPRTFHVLYTPQKHNGSETCPFSQSEIMAHVINDFFTCTIFLIPGLKTNKHEKTISSRRSKIWNAGESFCVNSGSIFPRFSVSFQFLPCPHIFFLNLHTHIEIWLFVCKTVQSYFSTAKLIKQELEII